MLTVPAYLSPLLEDENIRKMDLSFFVTAGAGGDGMTSELEAALNGLLRQHNSKGLVLKGYGMTEVCASAVTCFSYSCKNDSVGLPLPRNNIMIYDNEQETELSYHEIGEICLQSPSRMIEPECKPPSVMGEQAKP